LKLLQKQCWQALSVYTDLAEAACAMLINAQHGPLTPEENARFSRLRKQETESLSRYLQARIRLMAALSVAAGPADRGLWLALNAKA
jgi:hypothetical protein